MAQTIGQYRYTGSGCITDLKNQSRKDYVMTSFGSEGSASSSFKDIAVYLDFNQDTDYYFKAKIPQDVNYDLGFNVKLIKKENESADTRVFQFVKNAMVQKGGSGKNVYTVVLYEDPRDRKIKATIPTSVRNPPSSYTAGQLYYIESTDRYVVGNGGTSYTTLAKLNVISVMATWVAETTDTYLTIEMVFRPVESGFSAICLEMIRGAEDYNITRLAADGSYEYGRLVDLNKFDYEIYRVHNLVDSMNRGGTLDRIGITSHPDLLTIVNGEEIYLGPAGIYELDALPIESLGIVARGFEDNFIVDYEYTVAED